VFAGCFTEKGETELKKACSERLHAISLDVTSKESVRKVLEYVKAKLPQGRGLWGVLNNAGISTRIGAPDWFTVDDYKDQCDVNLWGVIDVTLTFLPLVKKEKGRIVNTASFLGRTVSALGLGYCVAKYGVEAFTDGIRRTIHYFDCKAILIEPGYHKTEISNQERIRANILKAWKEASPEVKAEYGEQYVKTVIDKDVNALLQVASDRLTDVVDAYEHALLGRFPRARYLVGKDANYLFIPIQALPEWLGDWIYRMLESSRPIKK
jgi:NAD(P)-dependent dehydrogenase (short-subunit alcohol dehydrogenase family)